MRGLYSAGSFLHLDFDTECQKENNKTLQWVLLLRSSSSRWRSSLAATVAVVPSTLGTISRIDTQILMLILFLGFSETYFFSSTIHNPELPFLSMDHGFCTRPKDNWESPPSNTNKMVSCFVNECCGLPTLMTSISMSAKIFQKDHLKQDFSLL